MPFKSGAFQREDEFFVLPRIPDKLERKKQPRKAYQRPLRDRHDPYTRTKEYADAAKIGTNRMLGEREDV